MTHPSGALFLPDVDRCAAVAARQLSRVRCSTCHVRRKATRMAPYHAPGSEAQRYACDSDACRDAARAVIRGEVAL